MSIDWIRLLSIIESAIILLLYLRTAYHGLDYGQRYKQNRPFNIGRGLASLGVVVVEATFIMLFAQRWNDATEPPYFLMAFLANILLLFGWVYSVRITLKEGRPDA